MSRFILILLAGLLLLAGIAWFTLGRSGQEPSDPYESAAVMASPWWQAEDRLIVLDGFEARVRIEVPQDAPAIVMVHGFSHSLESWDDWAAGLSDDYRVIRMDLPGHGLTGPDPQERYSVPETVDFLGQVLDALAVEEVVLAGNSLGGLVAWRYAADNPERVSKLVLVSPGGYSINGVTEDPVAVPLAIRLFMSDAPEGVVNAATASLYGNPEALDLADAERIFTLMRGEGIPQALIRRLEVFTLPDPTDDLARVDVPTLILWGEADAMVPVEHGSRFVSDMPDARLITYEGVGHLAHDEASEATLSDVRSFLEE